MKKTFSNAFLLGLLSGLSIYLILDSWVFPGLFNPPGLRPDEGEIPSFILVEMSDQLNESRERIVELETQLETLRKESAASKTSNEQNLSPPPSAP